MKKSTVMAAFAVAAVLGTAVMAGAMPVVSDVTMTQRVNSRMVDIGYTLTGVAAIVTLGIETNGVPIPDSAVTWLYKDVCKVVQTGTHTIVWDAGKDWPENSVTNAKARVTAWVTNAPPQVMVIDLSKGTFATALNPYPVFYYTSAEAVPRGVTDDLYKTDRILMQRLSSTGPTGFTMGDESNLSACTNVRLTQAFYAGVYQVTQKQWVNVMGEEPSDFKNLAGPVNRVSYEDIRGSNLGAGWSGLNADHQVDDNSFMGRLRSRTGLAEFDLPTEAQWEYACRAGTTTYYNDGISGSADSQLDDLGWWIGNSVVPQTVGQKTPNHWGLYDMHGNIWEWCLDWHTAMLFGGDDPGGADSGSIRVWRGGCWYNYAAGCRSVSRNYDPPSSRHSGIGFRLVRNLP